MAIKKSELYSSLWASCDELRGGMDASQYKDYVLTLLFVKYVSDKYWNTQDSLIEVPHGASFEDMIALKGKSDIGEQINKKILRPLFAANGLEGSIELVDFDDDDITNESLLLLLIRWCNIMEWYLSVPIQIERFPWPKSRLGMDAITVPTPVGVVESDKTCNLFLLVAFVVLLNKVALFRFLLLRFERIVVVVVEVGRAVGGGGVVIVIIVLSSWINVVFIMRLNNNDIPGNHMIK